MKKKAVVIGAASGVGKSIVSSLRSMGISVFEGDLLISPQSQKESAFYVDATDRTSVDKFLDKILTNTQHIDYLIITVGAIDEGLLSDYSVDNLNWMLKVNLMAPYLIVQAFLPLLKKSEEPKILLTGSVAGMGCVSDSGNLGPYIISKHALTGYAKALRSELKEKGIQVSLLLPNRIIGNLAENSAVMRKNSLNESTNILKGAQPPEAILTHPDQYSTGFIKEFLQGKQYIFNNEELVFNKLQGDLEDFKRITSISNIQKF